MHPRNFTSLDIYTGQKKAAALLPQATQSYLFAEDNSVGKELYTSKSLSFQSVKLQPLLWGNFTKYTLPLEFPHKTISHTREISKLSKWY